MLEHLRAIWADEDGAVTVDWVVLTAAIVGLAIAVLVSVRGGAVTMANNLADELDTQVPTVDFDG